MRPAAAAPQREATQPHSLRSTAAAALPGVGDSSVAVLAECGGDGGADVGGEA